VHFLWRWSDTTRAAKHVQLAIQRKIPGEQRLIMALEMSLFVRDLNRAGIRSDHPDWSNAQVERELLRFAFLPGTLPANLR
jgi:hypothetical protein